MYRIMIKGMATNFSPIIKSTEVIRKIYLSLLLAQLKLSNFKAKSGSSATSKNENKKVQLNKNQGV